MSETANITYVVTVSPNAEVTTSGSPSSFTINGLSGSTPYTISLKALRYGVLSTSSSNTITLTTSMVTPNLIVDFENNVNNTGTNTNIGTPTGGPSSYVTSSPNPARGTYCAYISGNKISYDFTSQTFPISVSFWYNPYYTFGAPFVILSVGSMVISMLHSGNAASNTTSSNPNTPIGLLTFQRFIDVYNNKTISDAYSKYYYLNKSNGIVNPATTAESAGNNPPTTNNYLRLDGTNWYHIVWVAKKNVIGNTSSPSAWVIYVNNVKYTTTDNSIGDLTSDSNAYVSINGNNPFIGRNGSLGHYDSLKVWNNYALSDSDVNYLYTN